jgi:hypothetical protein
MLQAHKLTEPHVHFYDAIDEAIAASKASLASGTAAH